MNVNPDAPIPSPLSVYASNVGSLANVVPASPNCTLTVAPFAYGLPFNAPLDVVHVTLLSTYGKNAPIFLVSVEPVPE